jgi:high-affinity iron transporter
MFQTYLIGLREGLEASLVVGILVAYLVRTDNRHGLPKVAIGVLAAVVLSFGFGALLTFTSSELSFRAQEIFGGLMSIVAVAFVTWMIFWMRATSHHLRGELHQKVDAALAMGPAALVAASFVAVAREGIETALFVWPLTQTSSGGSVGAFSGVVLGLLTSTVLGYLLYRRAVSIDLGRFFRFTGIGLVVIAAGVLAYAMHDLQEASVLPGLDRVLFDVSGAVPPTSWYGTLLKGIFNFNPQPTVIEFCAWLAYLVPVMVLFLRPQRPSRPTPTGGGATAARSVAVPTR